MSDVTSTVRGCGFKIFADTETSGGIVKALRIPQVRTDRTGIMQCMYCSVHTRPDSLNLNCGVQGKRISNSRIKPKGDVAAEASRGGAGGLAFLRVVEGRQLEGAKALREGLSPEQQAALLNRCGAEEGDLLLFAAGDASVVNRCSSQTTLPALRGACLVCCAYAMRCVSNEACHGLMARLCIARAGEQHRV
jgi:aspartyl-tRNA synthetase